MTELTGRLEAAPELAARLETPPEIVVKLVGSGPPGPPGPSDHRALSHRDAAGQHPMEAIEGLSAALSGKVDAGNVLSNLDIQNILGR